VIVDVVTGAALDQAADPGSYARAILNILADFSEEKTRLADVQRAMLNILEDSGTEKLRLEAAQKATLNILADFSDERAKLADVQKAVLNILEDFAGEKARLEATQKAVLNILEDFDAEKNKVEQINREMAREIGERKQAEEALEAANKELEAFSYSVSHDLRAPLRHILGFTDLLQAGASAVLDEKSRRYLTTIADSAKRMGNLIDDLLAFSRAGRVEMQRAPVSPAQLVQEALHELRQEIEGRNIVWKIAPLPNAYGDRSLLRLVWVNLIANAVKFTRTRAPAEIEIGCASGQENEIVFFVRDNGVGFDMKYVDKLFGVFQRLHRAEEFGGTGVGLANVRRIIHRHGGRTWAEGSVEGGAAFYFSLPKSQGGES